MGRHTRNLEEEVPPPDTSGVRAPRTRWIGKIPLLPSIALVGAVAVVAAALSTKQVSLNFGGNPAPLPTSTGALGDPGQQSASESLQRRSKSRSPFTVTLRTTSRLTGGFKGQLTITNRSGKAVRRWVISFGYPGVRIVTVRNAVVVKKVPVLVLRDSAYQPSIAPGRSVVITFTAAGRPGTVKACVINGQPCRLV